MIVSLLLKKFAWLPHQSFCIELKLKKYKDWKSSSCIVFMLHLMTTANWITIYEMTDTWTISYTSLASLEEEDEG